KKDKGRDSFEKKMRAAKVSSYESIDHYGVI
ncbi:unnamed protein product, partial [marine sediment metagenome]